MELGVVRTVDPHTLNVQITMGDVEIKAAIDSEDPDDLAFDVFLRKITEFTKAEYLRLVANLVEKAEQAARLGLSAQPPEFK